MRILMVTGKLPTDIRPNALASVTRQIESMRAHGLEVDVLEIAGARRLKYVQALSRLRQRLSSVDLVHAHYGYCGWVARMQYRKPVVVSFMGDDVLGTPDRNGSATIPSRFAVQLNRLLARTVDAVIVKSAEMARVVAPARPHVVPNGVDLDAFYPVDRCEARRLLGWSTSRRYILFPGNPDVPRKGYPLASAAVQTAATQLGEHLELVPLRGIPADRVPLYMNACDALLMTSFWEGSPNAVKEAMACNLPVVSVPVGDTPELLADVRPSMVCPRDPDALGAALARILSGPAISNGRTSIVRKKLDRDSVARTIISIYTDVLARKG